MKNFKDVASYINNQPKEARVFLTRMRAAIKKAAPKAKEGISYGMPVYKLNGPLVYFGGFKKHVSLFALPAAQRVFKKELAAYNTSKGTVQFQLDKPLPLRLITKIVRYRVKENTKKAN